MLDLIQCGRRRTSCASVILYYDELTGHGNIGKDILNPSAEDVVRSIKKLDQERFTMIMLIPSREVEERLPSAAGKGITPSISRPTMQGFLP